MTALQMVDNLLAYINSMRGHGKRLGKKRVRRELLELRELLEHQQEKEPEI